MLSGKMRGRFQVWVVIALCVAVFITFLAHRPACSSGDMLHNKPVPKFKALTADTDVKSGIGAMVEFKVIRPAEALATPPLEAFAAGNASMPAALRPQVLSCCFLC
jgi:hypothetical protein